MTNPRALLLDLARAAKAAGSASVLVDVGTLETALRDSETEDTGRDLTVDDLCRRYGRKGSCVRSWLEAGRFVGAFKLNNREWRVPADAVRAFDAGNTGSATRRCTADLGSWRKVRKPAS